MPASILADLRPDLAERPVSAGELRESLSQTHPGHLKLPSDSERTVCASVPGLPSGFMVYYGGLWLDPFRSGRKGRLWYR